MAGCGTTETRQHYIWCTASLLCISHKPHRLVLHQVHAKLHTAKVVYDVLISILNALRIGGHPKLVLHFNSSLERAVKEAWQEQKEIGWDQIHKGSISSKWVRSQAIYYGYKFFYMILYCTRKPDR